MNTKCIFLILMSISANGLAWGGKGHFAICETAASLVENEELRSFFKMRSHILGHLCNVPDTSWRGLDPSEKSFGDSAHYVDPEYIGLSVQDVPLSFSELQEKYEGTPAKFTALNPDPGAPGEIIKSLAETMGTNWWRADQFFRRALQSKVSGSEEQNQKIFDFMVNLGVMGHFVGDNSQPFHVTADYDGYAAGHGGIHRYYEEEVVAEFDSDLSALLLAESKQLKKQKEFKKLLQSPSALEMMRGLGHLSFNDISKVLKLDPILKKSELKFEKGMKIKNQALRKPAPEGLKAYKALVLLHMSRASLVLAELWDRAYKQAGPFKFNEYKSYKFPFQPDFVKPDYVLESLKN